MVWVAISPYTVASSLPQSSGSSSDNRYMRDCVWIRSDSFTVNAVSQQTPLSLQKH